MIDVLAASIEYGLDGLTKVGNRYGRIIPSTVVYMYVLACDARDACAGEDQVA